MSAISGIFRIDGQDVDLKSIKNMNNSLSHRGIDGSGVWIDGPVALAHQMLHTTPESLLEKLPFEDEISGMVITADARIDNRDELSSLLNLKNSKEVPDSLFILKAYQKWGENCPNMLLGDFAFAIWDPAREQLFCARDHMGIKPFYYFLSDDVFYFATEIKAILTLPDVPRKLNELKVAFYLEIMNLDKELTFYDNIIRLPGASSLKIDYQKHESKKYWEIDPEFKIEMDSEKEYITTFLKIFEEAVYCRLRSAFPVGFMLSGGLDSSSVVCMAKKILNEKDPHFNHIKTFSYVSDDVPASNERYYIEKTVDMGGIQANFIHGDKVSPFEEINTILQFQDQPFFSPHMSIFRNLYNLMHKKNIRVNLNGEGGDHISEIGSTYFKELFVSLNWKVLVREVRGFSKISNQNFLKIIMSNIVFPLIPRKIKEIIWNISGINNSKLSILNKDFSEKLGGEKYLEKIIMGPIEAADTTRKFHHLQLTEIAVETFNETRDVAGGEFSIESRSPFRDKRLVEFCYGVPTEIKFKYGWNRYLHRTAMKSIIPEEIRCKRFKHSNPPIIQRNLIFFGKSYLEKLVNVDNTIIADYIDLNSFKNVFHEYEMEGNGSNYLWLILILSFWLQNEFNP